MDHCNHCGYYIGLLGYKLPAHIYRRNIIYMGSNQHRKPNSQMEKT